MGANLPDAAHQHDRAIRRGRTTDTVARIIAEGMRKPLGQPIIIENVAGASATIGVGRLARAPGDGYTLGIGNWASHVLNGAVFTLPLRFAAGLRARCANCQRSAGDHCETRYAGEQLE